MSERIKLGFWWSTNPWPNDAGTDKVVIVEIVESSSQPGQLEVWGIGWEDGDKAERWEDHLLEHIPVPEKFKR